MRDKTTKILFYPAKRNKKILTTILITASITIIGISVNAHSGRTDANGGHKDNQNKSGLGSYHYHCGGHPAYLHNNGICPYASSTTTQKSTKTTTNQGKTTNRTTSTSTTQNSTSSKSSNNQNTKKQNRQVIKKLTLIVRKNQKTLVKKCKL